MRKMIGGCLLWLLLTVSALPSQAQFVWPRPEDNRQAVPGTYEEDPFITRYRREFFAVYRGDIARFERAMSEIQEMVKRNPNDARAVVWLGNGYMIRSGLAWLRGNREEARRLLQLSRETCDRAVSLDPDNHNIYVMRAVTYFLFGQFLPENEMPRALWETVAADLEKAIRFIGPERMPKVSPHVRGEIYGELGIAYARLGDRDRARRAFETIVREMPGSRHAERAQRELAKLNAAATEP